MTHRTVERIATELLVLRAKAGDSEAMASLYRLWSPVVLARCVRQLQDPLDAQDVAQKAWEKAMRGVTKIKDPACFAAWLLRIAHVSCIDFIRQKSRRRAVHAKMQKETSLEAGSAMPEMDATAMDLRAAILHLSAPQQDVLHLYYTGGFSTGEIAHISGIAVGTVKSRLHGAREKLKSKLETGDSDE